MTDEVVRARGNGAPRRVARGPSHRWTAAMVAAAGTMGTGLLVAALARLPLTWDGAWFFVRALDTGTPTYLYRRAIHAVLQAPAIVVSRISGDVGLAALAFSAMYVLVPLVALAAAWWVVRVDRPALILWPILGIALIVVPGQAFFVSEGAIVVHFAWVLVLAAALGRVRRHRLLIAAVIAVLAVSHPFAGPALVVIAGIAWVARRRGAGSDGPLVTLALLAAGAILTIVTVALRAPYEAEASSVGQLLTMLRGGVVGPPAVAVAVAWAIGASTLVRIPARARTIGIATLLVVAVVALVPWALDPASWALGLRFRAWFAFLAAPVIVLAAVDAMRHSPWVDRRLAVAGAPAVMAIVLACQGASWLALQSRLADDVAERPPGCVRAEELASVASTPLEHWSITSLALVLEGREPTHLVVTGQECAVAVAGSRVTIKVTPYERDDRTAPGWWGFDRLVGAWSPDP